MKKKQAWKTVDIKKISKSAEKLRAALDCPVLNTLKIVNKYLNNIMVKFKYLGTRYSTMGKTFQTSKGFWNANCKETTVAAKKTIVKYEKNWTRLTWEAVQSIKKEKNKIIRRVKTLYFQKSIHEALQFENRI